MTESLREREGSLEEACRERLLWPRHGGEEKGGQGYVSGELVYGAWGVLVNPGTSRGIS